MAARLVSAIPICVCGKTEAIGNSVIAGLKPDFEVVHFVASSEAGIVEIPALLSGSPLPTPTSSKLGSANFSQPPRAIVLGGAYDDHALHSMRNAVLSTAGARKVPWIKQDKTKAAPPLGPEYNQAIIARTREVLHALNSQGKLDGTNDDICQY